MEPVRPAGSSTGKVIAAVLLVGLGLAGLAMSLCGGFFGGWGVIEMLTGSASGEARQWATMFMFTGSASLVFGLLILFLAVVAWKRVTAAQPPRS